MKLLKAKSVMCVVLALILTSLMGFAGAETADLKALTDDEIVALLFDVNAEIVSRGIAKSAELPKGTYIAGEDIPAGSYVYTCRAAGDDWGSVTVYADGGDGDQLLWEVVSAPEAGEEAETFMVRLHDGDELKSGVPFTLTIAAGIVFK